MKQYRILTCEPESCCVSAVTIDGGKLKITLENGQEFTAALPVDEKGVVSGELRGEAIQLKNEAGKVVSTIDLSGLTPDGLVASGVLSGSNLLLKDPDGVTLSTINLSSLVPAAKADRFLSRVTYDNRSKKLLFTTSAQGEEDRNLEVNVSDLLPVVAQGGIIGVGTTADPLKLNLDSETLRLTPEGKLQAIIPAQSGGLDCEAIKSLDERTWESGMTVLAQTASGDCVRLNTKGSLFQDLSVGMSANKIRAEVGSEFVITTTVTNHSTTDVAAADLVLTRPRGTDYSIVSTQTVATNSATKHTTSDVDNGITYSITNLRPRDTFKVVETVRINAASSVTMASQVSTAGVDILASNNKDSITLAAFSKADNTYTATEECPAMVVTHVATGTKLTMATALVTDATANIVNTDSLAGYEFHLPDATTVVVLNGGTLTPIGGYISATGTVGIVGDRVYSQPPTLSRGAIIGMSQLPSNAISEYTFDPVSKKLRFSESITAQAVTVLARTGEGCRWQVFTLSASGAAPKVGVRVSGIDSQYISEALYAQRTSGVTLVDDVYGTQTLIGFPSGTNSTGTSSASVRLLTRPIIRVPAGKEYRATLTADEGLLRNHTVQGNIALTPTAEGNSATLVISAKATPADFADLQSVGIFVI